MQVYISVSTKRKLQHDLGYDDIYKLGLHGNICCVKPLCFVNDAGIELRSIPDPGGENFQH